MLYSLLSAQGGESLFFRSGLSFFIALIGSFSLIPLWIRGCRRRGLSQPIRDVIPEHRHKADTPTMGGVPLLVSLVGATVLCCDLTNPYLWGILLIGLGCGGIGLIDDVLKIRRRSGLRPRDKLLSQIGIGIIGCSGLLFWMPDFAESVAIPFWRTVDFGWTFIPLAAFFSIAGFSNAVNLTDGLDGLAIVPVMIASVCLGGIALLVANDLHIDVSPFYDPLAKETVILTTSTLGAGLGFLWYNAPPAKIFMGDTGALALGAFLGAWSIVVKHEVFFVIIGGLFVIEASSVLIQIISFQGFKKRVFLKSPLHHHFHLKGWPETTITIRFWILSLMFAISGMLCVFLF